MNQPIRKLRFPGEDTEAIAESKMAQTVRVLPIRMNSRKGILGDILFASNANRQAKEGHDNAKSGKFELPGGKAHDTESERKDFNLLSPDEATQKLIDTAVAELEEETGLYLNPNRLKFLGEYSKKIQGTYKPFPGATHFKTTYFVVVLDEAEYQDPLPKNWSAQTSSDDMHDSTQWVPIEADGGLSDEILNEFYAPSSIPALRNPDEIEKIIEAYRKKTTAKLKHVLTAPTSNINNNGSITTNAYGGEVRENSLISILDPTVGIGNMKLAEFDNAYSQHFGCVPDAPEIARARSQILEFCIPLALEESQKFDNLSKTEKDRIEADVNQRVRSIQDSHRLFGFFKFARKHPFGQRIIRNFLGYGKISQLDYFPYIEPHIKDFNKALSDILVDPKSQEIKKNSSPRRQVEIATQEAENKIQIRDFNGTPCFLEIESNAKTLERMVNKAATKVEVDPKTIKDVFRSRIVTDNQTASQGVVTFLKARLGDVQSPQANSWQLKEKTEYKSNVMRDAQREEIKLLGSFPVPGRDIRIPVEIQIMTKEEFQKNESGGKHHDVYVELLQSFFKEGRPTTPVPTDVLIKKVKELAHRPTVYNSYQDSHARAPEALIDRAFGDITSHQEKYFFETPKGYLCYQHIIRCLNAPDLVVKIDESFRDMAEYLNHVCGIKLHAQHWKAFFENPPIIIKEAFDHIGGNFFFFCQFLRTIKFGVSIDFDDLEDQFVEMLNTRCETKKDKAFWQRLLNLSSDSTVSDYDKKYIKRNKNKLRSGLNHIHAFNLDNLNV